MRRGGGGGGRSNIGGGSRSNNSRAKKVKDPHQSSHRHHDDALSPNDMNETDGGGASSAMARNMGAEFLPEDHTLMSESSGGNWSHGFDSDDDDDDDLDDHSLTESDDYLLTRNAGHTVASTAAASEDQRLAKLQAAVRLLDDFATEKRTARREAILKRVFKALTQSATGVAGSTMVGHVADPELHKATCLSALRVGSPTEQYAACRVLEAAAVVLAPAEYNYHHWYELVAKYLLRVIKMTTKATPVRTAALRALTLTHYMATVTDHVNREITMELMDLCQQLATDLDENGNRIDAPPAIRASALDCWALLASSLADFVVAGSDEASTGRGLDLLETLRDCLEETSMTTVDLRTSAGECVALIHESRLRLMVGEGMAGDDDHDPAVLSDLPDVDVHVRKSLAHVHVSCWAGTPWEVSMDEIAQRMTELSVESTKHLAKKTKKEQRAAFREYVATLEDNTLPEAEVAIRNLDTFTLHRWRDIIPLNFFRQCLQSGFQVQLLTNPVLQTIFRINSRTIHESAVNQGMSSIEKRLVQSKSSETSKNADLQLKKERHKRQHVKNHFLTADGDDM